MFSRLALATACALGIATAAPAFDLSEMTDAERDAFRAEVRAYLLDNPEVLMEAIGVLEQRQQQAQLASDQALVATYADALFNDGHSWVGGNPDGDITIVEFMDYRCGYCKRAFAEVEELVATDGNIRLILKEFPILGEQSSLAAQFAVAVLENEGPDAYKSIHDTMMTMRTDVSMPALLELAETFGLDTGAISDAMLGAEVATAISENHGLAQALDISGTPTFVFGDTLVRGYVPLEQMRAIVEDLRAEG